ncbi:PIR Superfamily Protein [Plasmodium ovale wallikeri]|uniref:PIR protein n=2 Tax=Plasmodium ovale TaxID=36330 RepID=A0A1C3KLG4_PLAOA|nr:PIR Superfamily Protein [Plasmodium ovale wallikeri]SBT74818.1 PIR protein [Plasmodium ovale]
MGSEDDNNLNLPSDKCYSELDTKYVNDGNDEKCEKLGKTSGEYTKEALLCMGLKGNLEKYEALDIFGKMNDYKCKYLSLWAHDRLSKLKGVEKATMMSTLLGIWIKSKQYEAECSPSQFPAYIDKDDHIKEKSLYDYALNYEELENRCKNCDITPCTRKLAEYITESQKLYIMVKIECNPNLGTNFQRSCIALSDIQKIYPNDELLNPICEGIEDGSKSYRNHERRGFEGELTESHSFGSHSSGDTSSSYSYKAIETSLPILAVLPIGFVLYKFTRLGSMARNLLRRGRINGMNSHDEFTNELLEDTYDDQAHPDITETYIGYQAT